MSLLRRNISLLRGSKKTCIKEERVTKKNYVWCRKISSCLIKIVNGSKKSKKIFIGEENSNCEASLEKIESGEKNFFW
jgi:hypothetical protein